MTKGKWKKLEKKDQPTGHIATYYSNDKANLPVRDVKKKWDSKADPNIETKTYGLFTTCMPASRKNIVQRNDSYIFFFTHWKGKRCLTGYYELDDYIDTEQTPTGNGREYKYSDYALRAKKIHFVGKPIPFKGRLWAPINPEKCSTDGISGYGPRNFKAIDEKLTKKLKTILDRQPDVSHLYIKEIKRLEKENMEKYGFKYPSWNRKEEFTRNDINEYIPAKASSPTPKRTMEYQPMGKKFPKQSRNYECELCEFTLEGQMCQLRKCPNCKAFALKQV